MIQAHYICNGCGRYTSYKGRMEAQLNVLTVDLTNYLLLTSGFKMSEPRLDVHFCDACFSKVNEGAAQVAAYGDVAVMRKRIESLEEELSKERTDHAEYRAEIARLLRRSDVAPKVTSDG